MIWFLLLLAGLGLLATIARSRATSPVECQPDRSYGPYGGMTAQQFVAMLDAEKRARQEQAQIDALPTLWATHRFCPLTRQCRNCGRDMMEIESDHSRTYRAGSLAEFESRRCQGSKKETPHAES
jgi:hypothetical protein